jgi:decaprenylphospho-beta-D-erythro-pentofuranosid-2-ulose 2-reductase
MINKLKYIIYGGTSLISIEIIKKIFIENKNKDFFLYIFCRNKKKFAELIEKNIILLDLNKFKIFEVDILDIKLNISYINEIKSQTRIDGLFFLVGLSIDANKDFLNYQNLQETYSVNLINPVIIINQLTQIMNGGGFLVVITSVAGVRGRKIRISYCSAKAGLSNYLSGLRQYLFHRHIKVIDIIAGYISTEKLNMENLPRFLVSSPKEVATVIMSAINRNQKTVYTKKIWFFVAQILKIIPDFIFQRLKF